MGTSVIFIFTVVVLLNTNTVLSESYLPRSPTPILVPTTTTTEEPETTTTTELVLVDGRVKTTLEQLVKCQCGAKEVMTRNGCQHYAGDIFVYAEDKNYRIKKVPVASLDVVVHEPECKIVDGHLQMNFTGEQFYLRRRGDVVLRGDVGHLFGLRINKYCVTHYMDDGGNVAWRMKACIPPPSIPRCCPPGEAMEGGQCRPAKSPILLTPPMSADIFKPAVPWPVIKNHINTINCTKHPIYSIPLEPKVSYLLNVPTGLVHIWDPDVSYITKKYSYPPEFCVDGRETDGGVVEYSAKICYTDPMEYHHKTCYGHTCVRKCCDYGQVMDTSLFRCIARENSTFKPPFTDEPVSYKVVIGKPLCFPQMITRNISINAQAQLYVGNRILPPTSYCVDVVHDGKGNTHDGALYCSLTKASMWEKSRKTIFAVCQIISLLYLVLTVLCYYLMPVLLSRGGWYQLFHATSLIVAYSSVFTHQWFGSYWDDFICIPMAIMMQFGFLSTFFWLSVLCFEVWRKIRSLNHFRPASDSSLWVYILYAFGGPFAICVLTLCMQFFAPDDVVGVIKPRLAEARCWFPGDMELLLYFYGPIAFLLVCNIGFIVLAYWNYRQIMHRTATLTSLEDEKPDSEVTKALRTADYTRRKSDYVSDFKQQFSLLMVTSTCWVFEILSWKIPPPEMWIFTDILNTLQGFFVFVIFMANRSNRKQLKRKFPMIFTAVKKVTSVFARAKEVLICTEVNENLHSTKKNDAKKPPSTSNTEDVIPSIVTDSV